MSTREIRYNAEDPTRTKQQRAAFQSEIEDRWGAVRNAVESYFGTDSDSLEYSTLRLNFLDYFEDTARQQFLEPISNARIRRGMHWSGGFVRTAYRRGLSIAKSDLQELGFNSYQITQATKPRRDEHSAAKRTMFEGAYSKLREHVNEAVSQINEELRQAVEEREDADAILTRIASVIDSIETRGRMHANTSLVNTVNEALITTFELAGVQKAGVAPEGVAEESTTNAIRVNADFDALESDPTAPDEVVLVTAGDSKVCEECRAVAGTTIAVGTEGVRSILPLHPNCRCSFRALY